MSCNRCFLLLLASVPASLALCQGDATSYFGTNVQEKQVYLDWVANDRNDFYKECLFLESSLSSADFPHGAALHWSTNATHVSIAVAVQADGWLGFGLSENGGMRGADMFLFAAADKNGSLTDAHVLQELYPIKDECQNWDLVNSTVQDGFIIVEATRELDTGDLQDRRLLNDTDLTVTASIIIMAWGDTETWSYHGNNFVRGNIRIFGDGQTETQSFATTLEEADGALELRANNFTIPSDETTYQEFCWNTNDLIALGVPMNESIHIIGAEAIVPEATRQYIHHFILLASSTSSSQSVSENSEPFFCQGKLDVEILYGWAPGGSPLIFPQNVGVPLGKDGISGFRLQIHYNNPNMDTNMEVDTSGIRLLWTFNQRQYDAGVFSVGDPRTLLADQRVGEGLASAQFDCPSTCSSLGLDEPVWVFREALHMHKSGVRASNTVKRNGAVVHEASVDFFDFAQNGVLSPQQEAYQIFAGDSFHSTCYYENSPGENQTFGRSSQDEMCNVFMYYYPRKTILGFLPLFCGYGVGALLPPCGAEYYRNELLSPSSLNRTFGLPVNNGNCRGKSVAVESNLTSGSVRKSVVSFLALVIAHVLIFC